MARILYVESDSDRAEQVCALLQQRGHCVQLERCAERAMLSIQQGGGFDLVALHLLLHGMDGAEFCRWIEANSRLRGIPKVAFADRRCALHFNFDEELPHWLPVDRFIAQLRDPASLVDAIEELLPE